jgi:hypothetical protein
MLVRGGFYIQDIMYAALCAAGDMSLRGTTDSACSRDRQIVK